MQVTIKFVLRSDVERVLSHLPANIDLVLSKPCSFGWMLVLDVPNGASIASELVHPNGGKIISGPVA